ncbi:MAG TPA: nitrophenyl compound nitroreductase subunit ArsF family protein [Candidatus Moranbacteria bacterium]|jgi:hypothetical protein|nr:hypothetical protein [Candidatus Moranbacteria bacterium]HOF42559.1 nitrophenyl compound nitroreductase subunit ArsF family protein [Candidatus Moranbacteria bacterium]HPX94762.1 nitrophenyl compound nitroreductase subunit ArsF family protein [Candidatus Moranbacteria bacterium]HQB59604.1 nitrophenyl compound nitroreductase subunit ArsF family protein [Candidatus Moranbacteria bacterium]
MKKLGIYLLYGSALFFAIALIYISANSNKNSQSDSINTQKNSQETEVQKTKPAEKIQVYMFHSTNRCHSCITIGQYTKATLEEFFQLELHEGKIEFKEINVDLPENKEIAAKFKAAGSSLFINPIIDGKDNIKEDTRVWRLISDKKAFSDYLVSEIKSLL